MKKLIVMICMGFFFLHANTQSIGKEAIEQEINHSLNQYIDLYKHLHIHPELSFMEVKTAERMEQELKNAGFQVTTGIGGNGLVGVFKNGEGPVIMVRTDMDALPIEEKTGLPFASKVQMENDKGEKVPVMHACGHDMHMSVFVATANTMAKLKDYWKGTLVFISQQAEERSGGASAMIAGGLFQKFPQPDYALAFHVSSDLPAGTIGYYKGATFAGVNSVNITFKGVGGHGAYPQKTIDPVVMASRAILAYQTIVSRELTPTDPAVVTVGSIHGGTQHNIIPDEVKLQLTLRAYKTEVMDQLIEGLERISKSVALSAGVPEDKMPVVEVLPEGTPPVVNDAELVTKSVASFASMLGEANVFEVPPAMVGEDFGRYGQTDENIPICLTWLGSVDPEKFEEANQKGTALPPLHSPFYYPDDERTLTSGAKAMVKALVDLMNEGK